jgi:predicted RNase H-like HicB family nuclease
MFYKAKVTRENQYWLAEFPDCPGCQTFAESEDELQSMAAEALNGWLEVSLEHGDVPCAPQSYAGSDFMRVDIHPDLAVRLQIRLARHETGRA